MDELISRAAVEDLIMETDPWWCEGMTRAIFEGVKRLPTIDADQSGFASATYGKERKMSESVFDYIRRKWQEAKLSLVKAFVKWSVQKLDKVSVGSFLAFSWGIDDVTDYHVIVERSYSDHHIYGTNVTYYADLNDGESYKVDRWWERSETVNAERSENERAD